MNRDALLHVVRAARMAARLAEDTKKLLVNEQNETIPDRIIGELADALFRLSGETLRFDQDFVNDSRVMRLLRSDMSDRTVTKEIARIGEENKRPELPTYTPQKEISREEFRKMVRENGGYLYEPKKREESKWKGTLKQLHSSRKENEKLHNLLIRAANELCIKCSFKSDPMLNGNCDNCRWQKIRYGEMPDDTE